MDTLDQSKKLLDHTIPSSGAGGAIAFEVIKGQLVRITARSTAVFIAFNLHNSKERFDQARTRNNQRKIYPTKGDFLFSKDNNIMMTFVEDSWQWHHDLQAGVCTRKSLELLFKQENAIKADLYTSPPYNLDWGEFKDIPKHGCRESLVMALHPWGIRSWEIPGPLNLFQNMSIDFTTGSLRYDHPSTADDAFVTLRAETDLLVAIAQHWNTTTQTQVFEGWPANLASPLIEVSYSN
jgi:uncharacterized protein YcgI (DUF1989 family)